MTTLTRFCLLYGLEMGFIASKMNIISIRNNHECKILLIISPLKWDFIASKMNIIIRGNTTTSPRLTVINTTVENADFKEYDQCTLKALMFRPNCTVTEFKDYRANSVQRSR